MIAGLRGEETIAELCRKEGIEALRRMGSNSVFFPVFRGRGTIRSGFGFDRGWRRSVRPRLGDAVEYNGSDLGRNSRLLDREIRRL